MSSKSKYKLSRLKINLKLLLMVSREVLVVLIIAQYQIDLWRVISPNSSPHKMEQVQ